MKLSRRVLVQTIWNEARNITGGLSSFNSETDVNPEVLHFWMRGYSSTEPGEWEEKYEDSEPAKYQSACAPVEQVRIGRGLKPFRKRDDPFCHENILTLEFEQDKQQNEALKKSLDVELAMDSK